MPTIKIHPPEKLPDSALSEQQFQIYKTELEVYLSSDEKLLPFLTGGPYGTWRAAEGFPDRLHEAKRPAPGEDIDDANVFARRKRDLMLFLSLVAKTVSVNHYSTIMQHSTSLQWIYDKIREDYDIQTKGIHLFNILDIKYSSATMTHSGFYNQYRTVVMNNLAKAGDIIKYKSNDPLPAEETLGPTFEDIILIQVLALIDARLPQHIREVYSHKIDKNLRLMDFKADIFVNIEKFKKDIEEKEQLSAMRTDTSTLGAFTSSNRGARGGAGAWRGGGGGGPYGRGAGGGGKGRGYGSRPPGWSSTHCRNCWRSNLGKDVYNSHNTGDASCPTGYKFSNMEADMDGQPADWELEQDLLQHTPAQTTAQTHAQPELSLNKVSQPPDEYDDTQTVPDQPNLSYIKPVPTQILTVYEDEQNRKPIHIELDPGATVSYVNLKEVESRDFKISPNKQMSKLGDGITLLPSIGEINVTFYRNNWSVVFRALVVKNLHAGFVGGTTFIVDNGIDQRFQTRTIDLHNKKFTVMDTKKESIMPISSKVSHEPASYLAHIQPKVLLPDQTLQTEVKMAEGSTVLVEGWHSNQLDWPYAQLCTVEEGKVKLHNNTNDALTLGKKGQIKTLKISKTEEIDINRKPEDNNYYKFQKKENDADLSKQNIKNISFGKNIKPEIKTKLDIAHLEHSEVFNEKLDGGYNHYYGKHECKLNWASKERPQSNKLRVANYNHDLNGLLQEVIDDLTDQKVLARPEDLGITVQSCCPAFLKRKNRAKNIDKQLLTKKDVRLLINYGPVNDKIKDIPTPMTTTDDIFNIIGRWKHIIVVDMHNGFFQNHMHPDAMPWLAIMSPYGGLRVMTRSGQGLLGQSEELNLLIKKILKDELQAGKCCQIVDDIYIGGDTQEEAAANYISILQKFTRANLKFSSRKVFIFPQQADILGWVWRQGGKIEPSPHRKNALTNTKTDDIKKIKDMRSWIGLYKTLRRATPNIYSLLEPLEKAVAGAESKDDFIWTHDLEMSFREAKSKIPLMHTLYLPSPHDQLLLEPDGSVKTPGIGHILFAVKEKEKIPVRFHSVKLPEGCIKWSPCELEALSFATGIEAEYDLIRESKHPLLICPDSKVVGDAAKLIKEGKFSASSRINRFITNINKVQLDIAHISGKAKLNETGDYQSRQPSSCSSEICSVCNFVTDMIQTVLDPAAKNAAMVPNSTALTNRASWLAAQKNCDSCKAAFYSLTSGKTPTSKVGTEHCATRLYCREAHIAKDGLLVVKEAGNPITGDIAREKIVIPQALLDGLLYQLHNTEPKHPTKTQLKAQFQRLYYAIGLDSHLAKLYNNCYPCSILQRLPKTEAKQESKSEVTHPHRHFHADVIKRSRQKILLVKDHFSSLHTAMLIQSEQAQDLKDGLVHLTQGIRHPGWITMVVDNAKGFESLVKQKDEDLLKLKINLQLTDEFNKNANSVVDRGCQELEEELRKISPEAAAITPATLSQAVLAVNQKLRRKGTISAYEIHTARDLNTGENLNLKDDLLRDKQLKTREDQNTRAKDINLQTQAKVGDTVTVINRQDKHNVRDMFLVTGTNNDKVQAQKILHPLTGQKKIMSKVYNTDQKRLIVLHSSEEPTNIWPRLEDQTEPPVPQTTYNPVNPRFWIDEDSSSDDDDGDEQPDQHAAAPAPPPPPLPAPRSPHRPATPPQPEQVLGQYDVNQLAQLLHNGGVQDHAGELSDHDGKPGDGAAALPQEDDGSGADDEDDDTAGKDDDDDTAGEDDNDEYMDQSRQPRKGDIITYHTNTAADVWAEARITSCSNHKYYYNIVRLDTGEALGIYLLPAPATETGRQEAWTLGRRRENMRSAPAQISRQVSPARLEERDEELFSPPQLDLTPDQFLEPGRVYRLPASFSPPLLGPSHSSTRGGVKLKKKRRWNIFAKN